MTKKTTPKKEKKGASEAPVFAAQQPEQVSLIDLANMVRLIDVMCDRGAVKGPEMGMVSTMREKIVTIVEYYNNAEQIGKELAEQAESEKTE